MVFLKNHDSIGLAALDMKSGCCASMLALRKFNELHKDISGKIIATFVSYEEGLLKDVNFTISTEPSAGFNNRFFPYYAKVKLFWLVVMGEDEEKIESYIISVIKKAKLLCTIFLESIKNVCDCDAHT